MEVNIAEIVNILRPFNKDVVSGKSTLALSANYIQKLNNFADNSDDSSNSFHITESNITKSNRVRETQFILSLFQNTQSLKIHPDIATDSNVNISRFSNIKILEILKVDINLLTGLQKLRSQLQEITCYSNLQQFGDVLMKCGGDNSQPYNWNELKKAKFSMNNILEMDNSFDWTLSLQTLDISHNNLSTVDIVNQLPNLKYLNISYNKLYRVPHFVGPVCSRLQILVLKNNFIEDVTGLCSLVNIVQLDLNQNSLIDHNLLCSISHLISLQCFNVSSNPLSFHPNHRNLTCSYLNKNVSSVKFLLDGTPLSKSEKGYVGLYRPVPQVQPNVRHFEESHALTSSIHEKPRKIRNVDIEDKNESNSKTEEFKSTPSPSNDHLLLKKQIEQLRQEYGEGWLNRQFGTHVEDVLGFEKSLLSSTPKSTTFFEPNNELSQDNSNVTFKSANDNNISEAQFVDKEDNFFSANELTAQTQNESDSSDGEDVFTSGEECIYVVRNKSDDNHVFVVVNEKFISERDVTTSKEKARWHVNTIVKCEKQEDNVVKLEFNTLRRDRKLRLYEPELNELETFYIAVKEKIDVKILNEEKKTYQCMKCSKVFKKVTENTLDTTVNIECPLCYSNLVIEQG